MSEKTFIVDTPDNFQAVILYLLQEFDVIKTGAIVVTLQGDLGAGKTTFVQQLAKHLGVTDTVVSPTFGIMKLYELSEQKDFDQLIHIDAYRIEDISEAGPLHLAELITTPRSLFCIEWPEHIQEILPEDSVKLQITITENDSRMVVVL